MAYQSAQPGWLLRNVNVDTVGTAINIPKQGPATVIVNGSLGGGTITLQISLDNTIFTTLVKEDGTDFTVTAPTQFALSWLNAGLFLRATLAGSSGASAVNVAI